MAQQQNTTMQTIVMDGKLKKAEAIKALNAASQAATGVLLKCKPKQKQKVLADRDVCLIACLNCLDRSLKHTGPLFERMAKDLNDVAKKIVRKSQNRQNVNKAVNLLSDAVRLAGSLSLAFA